MSSNASFFNHWFGPPANSMSDQSVALAEIEKAIRGQAEQTSAFSGGFIRDQRDVWQRATEQRSPTEQLDDFKGAISRLPSGSPTRRRHNEFFAITGQPVEKCFRLDVPCLTPPQALQAQALTDAREQQIQTLMASAAQADASGSKLKSLESCHLQLSLLLPTDAHELALVRLMLAREYLTVGSPRHAADIIQEMLVLDRSALWIGSPAPGSNPDPMVPLKEYLVTNMADLLGRLEPGHQMQSIELIDAAIAVQVAKLEQPNCPNTQMWQAGKERNEKFRKKISELQSRLWELPPEHPVGIVESTRQKRP